MAFQYDTKNQSFRQVMGNGLKYEVPRFQRDYSWKKEQWYDLWQDILEIKKSGFTNDHYMGYLVLKSDDNKNFVIIDGPQRITTNSIFILSVLKKLQNLIDQGEEAEDNQKRKETLSNSFIGFTDSISLSFKNKLTLNQNNNTYFTKYLCRLKPPPHSKLKVSEKFMGEALNYFTSELDTHQNFKSGRDIAEFVENIVDRLVCTTITVGSESNAYTIFETLNARGVQLSTPDLVKNYIFSLIDSEGKLHESELTQLEERWSAITKQLGKHKFSDFIRVDWNSRHQFTRNNYLFREIKKDLNNKQKADHYLDHLQKNSEIYSALNDEKDEFWRVSKQGLYSKKLVLALKTLRLFNITNPQSALIAFFHKFDQDKFLKFLSDVEALSIRYNVIGNHLPGSQERVYSEITQTINSQDCNLEKVRKILKKIYPDDVSFIQSFKEKVFKITKTDKKVRYLLKRIEQHLNKETDISEELDSHLTLEHILPQNPSPEWKNAFEDIEEMESCFSYIGNMTLLSQTDNKDLGNQPFTKKKEQYKKSSLKVTQKIADYACWNRENILQHQNG